MTKKKKPGPKPKEPEIALVSAMKFVKKAQSANGDTSQTHVRIHGGYVVGFDRVVAAGYPIPEQDLDCCPNSAVLEKALKNFKKGHSITQEDAMTLRLTMGKMTATIPCVNPAQLTFEKANPPMYDVKDEFVGLMKKWKPLVKGSADAIMAASMKISFNSILVTNLDMIVEAWHGFGFPFEVVVPHKFLQCVTVVKTPLVKLGVDEKQLTFHYADGAWWRTQCWDMDSWLPTDQLLHAGHGAENLPVDFFKAVNEVLPFTTDDIVYITGTGVGSHVQTGLGAFYELQGLPDWLHVKIKGSSLLALDGSCHRVVWSPNGQDENTASYFFGDATRAAVKNMGW